MPIEIAARRALPTQFEWPDLTEPDAGAKHFAKTQHLVRGYPYPEAAPVEFNPLQLPGSHFKIESPLYFAA